MSPEWSQHRLFYSTKWTTAWVEGLYAPSPSPPHSAQSPPSPPPNLASVSLSNVVKDLRSPSPLDDPFSDAEEIASLSSGDPFADSHKVKGTGSFNNEKLFDYSHEVESPAAMVGSRNGVYAEESAEVEVLSANLDKLKGLTRKIQGSLTRLETSGNVVKDAIGPIYSNTQTLQNTNGSTSAPWAYGAALN